MYLIIPLLPSYPGQIGTRNADTMQTILYHEYQTLFRAENSIFKCLKKNNIEPSDYILLMGLRQHGLIKDVPFTEMIYVHSKIMIVDDIHAIIGSANLNDRSMLGNRDSEIVVHVEEEVNSINDSLPPFAKDLRIKLMSEHFGIDIPNDLDPVSLDSKFWNEVKSLCEVMIN